MAHFGNVGSILDIGLDDWVEGKQLPSDEYGLFLMGKLPATPHHRYQLRNLKVFVSACLHNSYLAHGNYRFMKKATISLIDPVVYNCDVNSVHQFAREFSRCRLFCNGKDNLIVPTKYMK